MISVCVRSVVAVSIVILAAQFSMAQFFPGTPADYNDDGIVSHADYSVLGDTLGSATDLRADGDRNGVVTLADFHFYVAHYGNTASSPGILPLAVVAAPLPSGNLEWTFTFSNVNGSLAGHLNISSSETIISVTGGPGFLDDGSAPLGVPGMNAANMVQQGISFTSGQAFVALGTTLLPPQALLNSNSTLEFFRMVTKNISPNTIPTTLTFAGEYGYQGVDYFVDSSTTFVPEPATWLLVSLACSVLSIRRSRQIRR